MYILLRTDIVDTEDFISYQTDKMYKKEDTVYIYNVPLVTPLLEVYDANIFRLDVLSIYTLLYPSSHLSLGKYTCPIFTVISRDFEFIYLQRQAGRRDIKCNVQREKCYSYPHKPLRLIPEAFPLPPD